jgi:hypothetical protein
MYSNNALQPHRPDALNDSLYVLTPIFNPMRYRARWKHYVDFEKYVLESGANLVTIECSFGERTEVIVEQKSERHIVINVRTVHELWLKENLLNVAINHLTILRPHWKYLATIDADMTFARYDWVGECLQQLQHYPIIQMFSQVAYLNPDNEILNTTLSFMEGWKRGIPFQNKHGKVESDSFFKNKYGDHHHHKIGWAGAPGGAWAYRRDALSKLGGLIDVSILGSADYHMATALMGFIHISMGTGGVSNPNEYHPEYIKHLIEWQERALKYINRNVGHMKGTILHHWHGKMKDRGYDRRWKMLIRHQYNPRTDLIKDVSGVYQLSDDKWQLRDDIREYFRQRNEDSIDL